MSQLSNTTKAVGLKGATIHSYVTGFILSVMLTIVAYASIVQHTFSRAMAIGVVVVLAVVQCLVQLFFFLHLGNEKSARWKIFVLLFMLLVVGILVGGSIWIMNNLNYRMTSTQINTYLHDQDGL
jgi:cytochrome o ubiquinol oxidase operon protein cyoD